MQHGKRFAAQGGSTMRFKSFCILMGLGLAFADVPNLEARTGQNQSISVSKEIDATDSYSKTRWVGLRSKGSDRCPEVEGWTGEDLLGRVLTRLCPLQVAADDMARIRHLSLDRVCIYNTDAEKDFVVPPGMVAQRDRMALSGHADPLEQRVWRVLEKHFLEQAGRSSLSLRGGPSVRLAFIDSQADGEDLPSERPMGSQHGYTLAHLARRLVCPADDGICAAKVVARRALKHPHFRANEPFQPLPAAVGGYVGSISELAEAIMEEVLHWQKKGDRRHLILNLSLGWDGELALLDGRASDLQTGKVEDLEPSVQAVFKALQFARKEGVLVIAAAGNRRGGKPESGWPLLPAAWELRRPPFLPLAFGDKPVYAVGGVDGQGLPLPNSRFGGHPRRAAYGDHAVTAVGNHPTGIYTGSSVSAAVVSSIAAVVWHLRPELRPDQVMALIDKSGDVLDARASFYPWSKGFLSHLLPVPKLRRISLCTAVEYACGPGAVRCPALESVPECSAGDRRFPDLTSVLASLPAYDAPVYQPASFSLIPPCDSIARLWTGDGQVPADPCPTEQFSSVSNQRWVFPQPDDPPCPSCSVYSKPPMFASVSPEASASLASDGYALAIDISPDWCQTVRLVSATLDFECFERGVLVERMTYPIDVCPSTGEPWSVPGLGPRRSLLGCRAQLNFVVEKDGKKMSIQNPVVVDP
jgi:hypothetical protein